MEKTQVKGKGRRRKVVGEREDEKGGDCEEGERKRKTRGRRGEKKGGSCRKREREEGGRERMRRREGGRQGERRAEGRGASPPLMVASSPKHTERGRVAALFFREERERKGNRF